jgi:STE24 endopeptidase
LKILLNLLLLLLLSQVTPAVAEIAFEFDVEESTIAYLNQITPEQRAASDAYFEGGYWLDIAELFYGLVIAWILLHFGISIKIRDLGERLTRFGFLRITSYVFVYTLIIFVLTLPYVAYRYFSREHEFGLSNLSFMEWFGEGLIELGIEVVLSCLGLALIYLVIRKAPRMWPVLGGIASIVMLGFLLLIAPVFVNPLFNDYQSLEEGSLKEKILSMARANGVPAEDVYIFDASRQSKRISANVSGLFGTTRISLNDNLLDRTSPEGVQAVLAHEIGHYALNHAPKMLIGFGIIILIGFAFVSWSFDKLNKPAWGVRNISDIAGLPLLLAIFSVYIFLMTPAVNSLIRINEIEADVFGLNAARQPDGFAEAILGLSEYRKMNPGDWEEILFFDHPSGYNRIHMAMQWKKENLAAPKE